MLAADRVKTDGLTVSVTGATATAKGSVNLDKQMIDVGLGVVAADLSRLLDEMGLPPIAKSARIDAKADGSFEDPRVSGEANVQGINAGGRKLPELVAKFGLERGTLRLEKLAGPLFGGQNRRARHRPAVGEARQQAAEVADRGREAGSARHRSRDAGAER